MPQLDWRSVVAAPGGVAQPRLASHGQLAVTSARAGVRIARVLFLPKLPASGSERAFDAVTPGAPPGSVTVSAVVLDPGFDRCRPWEPPASLIWCAVVSGDLRVAADSTTHDDLVLGAGEVLVDEGGRAAIQACTDRPTRLLVAQFAPDETATPPMPLQLRQGPTPTTTAMRRVVVNSHDGVARLLSAGMPAVSLASAQGDAIDVWQTGGPVTSDVQGGDADSWTIEPVRHGARLLWGRLPARHDPGDAGWHKTATIDVGVVISGSVEMHLRETVPTLLGPGDLGILYATEHRWVVPSETPLNRLTFLFAVGAAVSP
jgi:hypothetical protein